MHISWFWIVMLSVLGCGSRNGGSQSSDMRTRHVQAGDSILLSAKGNAQSVPIPTADVAGAEVLQLTVAVVRNPDRSAVQLNLSVKAGARNAVPIGSIALFPVDRGGTFSIRVPEKARELIAAAASERREVQLLIELTPDPRDIVDRRAIRLAAIRWLQRPDR
jgi:hypothetical protein